jgi:hypothetical protein
MTTRLAALVAATLACAQLAHAATDPRSARPGFVADTAPPQANPTLAAPPAPFATSLDEGFDDITLLAGNGWFLQNNSSPVGLTNWFQGTNVAAGGPFDAFDGAPNSYIGANFNNTTGGNGIISSWLVTPVLEFGANATVTFYTRKPATPAGGTDYPDRLEVRLSTNGASTNIGAPGNNVGDYTTLLLSINPTLVAGGYPYTWTQYTVTGLPHNGQGRVAFRYFVTGAGPSGSNSDYIGIDRVQYSTGAPEYQVGGTVNGLAGSGLVLRLNGVTDLPVNANGSFLFPPYITNGGSYAVTVATQPTSPRQTCTVTNGSGTISGTVNNVQVACTTNTYAVGGSVSGLAGSGLVLHLDNGDDLAVAANGGFTFPTAVADGAGYVVSIGTQPSTPSQTCSIQNGAGTIDGADISNVQVTCTTNSYLIGGTVSGLSGSGLALKLDNGDTLPVAANGAFLFPNPRLDGSTFAVTVASQPSSPRQTCSVTNGSGTLSGQDVTTVMVSCVTNTYSIGGHVTGLVGSGLTLQLNGGQDLAIANDGPFTFATPLADGSAWTVTVSTQPSGGSSTLCRVRNGQGVVKGMSVADVEVTCDYIFLNGFELP